MASRYPQEPPNSNLLEFARTANSGAPKRPSVKPKPPGPSAPAAAPAVASVPAPVPAPALVPQSAVQALGPSPVVAAQARRAPVAKARQGTGGVLLLSLMSVLGFVVTLYRNDALLGLAHAAGLDASYLRLEHALGSPGFGTPRSLDVLRHVPVVAAAALPAEAAKALASAPAPEREEVRAEPSAAAEPEEDKPPAGEPVRAEPRARPRAAAPLVKVSAAVAPKAAASPAKHVQAAAKHEDAEPKAVTPAEEPSNDSPPPEKHSASKKKEKDAEPKQDTAPALSLDDAIKASMEKKKH